ncbi:hypothetical protein [Tsuneonella sp. HG222]
MAFLRDRAMPLAAALAFALLAVFYATNFALYDALIRAWGHIPFERPFLDTEVIVAAARCHGPGMDIWQANPCDSLGRPSTYPPTWLFLGLFPVTEGWTMPLGILVDLVFVASLFLLPRPRSWAGAALLVLGVLSSATVFAMERGNVDLLLFALIAGTAALSLRGPVLRLAGYALAFIAALLKYYPAAVLALALRERPRRFVAIAAACALGAIVVFALLWGDFLRAVGAVPGGWHFRDTFGAPNLATGWAALTGTGAGPRIALWLGMCAACLLIAARFALQPATRAALATLTERERMFLLAGSLLVAGCFFPAQNIEYRAVHLLLVLPSLVALAGQGLRYRLAAGATLLALWGMTWRHFLADPAAVEAGGNPAAFLVLWLVGEVLWWTSVTVQLSCVLALLLDTPVARALLPARLRPPGTGS